MPIDLTSDVTTVANTATIDVDTAAGDNDGNGVVAAAGGVVQIFGNGNGSQSAVQYDIQSWEIETGARIEVIGFNADIILSPLDKARFDNADFEIVGIDPAWTIQANVPTAPLFWMKGSEPSQFSGSGDSLVISSSSPDLYPGISTTFSQFNSRSMPTWNPALNLLEFNNDGMQLSEKTIGWVFVVFKSVDQFGDILLGSSGRTSPAFRMNQGGIAVAGQFNAGASPTNDPDPGEDFLELIQPFGQYTSNGSDNWPGGNLSLSTPYFMAAIGSPGERRIDLFGVRGNNADPSRFKVWELLIFSVDASLTEAQISLIQSDMAYRAVAAGIGTLGQLLGSDHEHYAQRPSSGGTPGAVNSVNAPPLVLTVTGLPAGGIFSIWDDEDEAADPQNLGTLLQTTNPTTGGAIEYIAVAGDPIVLQFVPNSGDSALYKELNFPITVTQSQTLDLSNSLEPEDNL